MIDGLRPAAAQAGPFAIRPTTFMVWHAEAGRDYVPAQVTRSNRGHSMAQWRAAAAAITSVARRACSTTRAPTHNTRSRNRRRLQPVLVAAASRQRPACRTW
jgi:hypothetical protein